jgi:uncharacterized protein YbjT (DUF2867 family)
MRVFVTGATGLSSGTSSAKRSALLAEPAHRRVVHNRSRTGVAARESFERKCSIDALLKGLENAGKFALTV